MLSSGDKLVDLDGVLSVKIIREHTKTDDNPSLTDELLLIYRKAAIEAAEKYTGKLWSGSRIHTQEITATGNRRRSEYTVDLDYPAVDGVVTMYGGGLSGPVQTNVAPGSGSIRVPHFSEVMDSCCRPCGNAQNFGIKAVYRVGLNSCSDIPAGIIMGCLKYIAWCISNRGDELVTMRNSNAIQVSGISGTNNAAWASGAIEEWRAYRR